MCAFLSINLTCMKGHSEHISIEVTAANSLGRVTPAHCWTHVVKTAPLWAAQLAIEHKTPPRFLNDNFPLWCCRLASVGGGGVDVPAPNDNGQTWPQIQTFTNSLYRARTVALSITVKEMSKWVMRSIDLKVIFTCETKCCRFKKLMDSALFQSPCPKELQTPKMDESSKSGSTLLKKMGYFYTIGVSFSVTAKKAGCHCLSFLFPWSLCYTSPRL